MEDGSAAFTRLLDRVAIVDLTIAYCWALDTGEWESLRAVFTSGATARLGQTDHDGVEEIIERCRDALSVLDGSQHMVTNHEVSLDATSTPERGTCRCYFQAQHVRADADGGPNHVIAGRYDDEVVRTDEGWRIDRRVLTVLWTEGNPAVTRRG